MPFDMPLSANCGLRNFPARRGKGIPFLTGLVVLAAGHDEAREVRRELLGIAKERDMRLFIPAAERWTVRLPDLEGLLSYDGIKPLL